MPTPNSIAFAFAQKRMLTPRTFSVGLRGEWMRSVGGLLQPEV